MTTPLVPAPHPREAKPRTSLHQVLTHFKELADGDLTAQAALWEQFIIVFLRQDPLYRSLLKNVSKSPAPDLGINITAEERDTGRRWAFQAKFGTRGNDVSQGDIKAFMSAAEGYDERVVVSPAPLGENAWKSLTARARPGRLWGPSVFESSLLDFQIFLEQAFFETQSNLEHSPYHAYKELRPHQKDAVAAVLKGFETHDRGKLIMACGTGKTFTALKVAEAIVPLGGSVLFLTASLSRLSQTLHEWQSESRAPFRGIAVCSDAHVRRPGRLGEDEENPQLLLNEFSFPVTTDARELIFWFRERAGASDTISVVYSTYHSIEAVSQAQREGSLPAFDLIICDDAHYTAAIDKKGKPQSPFSRVHDANFIRATKRLYMTATPKIYGPDVVKKVDVEEAAVCSMDDESLYGPEFHRLGFGSAVKQQLLCDYKVIILMVDEGFVNTRFRECMGDPSSPLDPQPDEVARVVACLNGLRKHRWDEDNTSPIRIDKVDSTSDKPDTSADNKPMRRALAFLNTIKDSKRFIKILEDLAPEFSETFKVEGRHVDGTMNAGERSDALSWLREPTKGEDPPECRILSNVRCLSEGVDIPALDAVIFLAPRKSKIDIVQSIGRVTRRAPGKEFGYIILPLVIPEGLSSEEEIQKALNDNKRYDHIWEVLEALRSHDDHLDIHIDQLKLNESDTSPPPERPPPPPPLPNGGDLFEHLRKGIRAKIVERVGTRWYWRTWATQVGEHARETSDKIHKLLKDNSGEVGAQFDKFLTNLQATLNSSIRKEQAIDMLAQHLVARPVFDALFKDYEFAKQNPVSQAMQGMLDILSDEKHGIKQENDELNRFYNSIKWRIDGINSASGRQHLILDIYNNFFSAVLPKTAKNLGIVYTPTEIVDFILHSVNYVSKKELNKSLADEGVRILDPFVGTGTFMARLIQSDLIPDDALPHKFLGTSGGADYDGEFYANEIVPLAYYIASINIEEAYHSRVHAHHPFGGMIFGDTFQMAEDSQAKEREPTLEDFTPGAGFSSANTRRAEAQKQGSIQVIVGNPPYSSGQKSANDVNQNQEYPHLNGRIRETYVKHGFLGNKRAMYDSSSLALRFASDRIGDEGVIGFVTNGSFLDSGSAAGLRYCLLQEFSHVYCFDLRGNIRLSGKRVKKEGGSVFGSYSRIPVVILILVKKPGHQAPGTLHYHDIGDSLTGKEKLAIIAEFGSIENIPWREITSNKYHDWLNQRDETLNQFIPMGLKRPKGEEVAESIFTNYSMGVRSNCDAWVYNFSREAVLRNMQAMIKEYNRHLPEMQARIEEYDRQLQEIKETPSLKTAEPKNPKDFKELDTWINKDPKQIKWSGSLKSKLYRQERLPPLAPLRMALSQYRPFAKRHLYYEPNCLQAIFQQTKFFPTPEARNKVICISSLNARKDFSALMVGSVPENSVVEVGQCFPLYTWEKGEAEDMLLAQLEASRQDNITDYALSLFHAAYPDEPTITKEDIFHYVYGILHSPEYRARFDGDLKKILTHIPLAHDFALFRDAGAALAALHLNYESAELCDKVSVELDGAPEHAKSEENFAYYRVERMKFGKLPKVGKTKSIIHYNDDITLGGIPLKAYDYKINDRSAIEWIMDQYRVQTEKDSGIENDPNDLAREHDNPRYILDLLLRVITVSLGTMKIINSLPTKKSFREDPATLAFIKAFAPPSHSRH